jgi:hypothetical protein
VERVRRDDGLELLPGEEGGAEGDALADGAVEAEAEAAPAPADVVGDQVEAGVGVALEPRVLAEGERRRRGVERRQDLDAARALEVVLVAGGEAEDEAGGEVAPRGLHEAVLAAEAEVARGARDYVPSATPGARAPHAWLGHPEARLSRLDLFGSAFTLLAAPGGSAWCTVAAQVERELGVPIDGYRMGGPGLRDLGGFTEAYGLGEDGAVLVRPDGHVAWRRATGPGIGAVLRDAAERVLGRQGED